MLSRIEKLKLIFGKDILTRFNKKLPIWFISSMVELIGIVGVMPVFYFAYDIQSYRNYSIVNDTYNLIELYGFDAHTLILIITLTMYSFLLILLTAIKSYTLWSIHNFVEISREKISVRIFENILNKKYQFFINNKASTIEKEVLLEVDQLVSTALKPIIMLVINLLSILFVALFLMIYDIKLAIISIIILLSVIMSIKSFLGNKVRIMGEKRRVANEKRFEVVSETIHNITSIKTLLLEKSSLKIYSDSSKTLKNNLTNFFTYNTVPSLWIEPFIIIITSLILMVLVIINNEFKISADLLPVVGIYAMALLRIKPNLQVVASSISSLQYATKIMTDFSTSNLFNKNKDVNKKLTSNNTNPLYQNISKFSVIDLEVLLSGTKILEKFSLEAETGDIIFIKGESGSGKSLVIKSLLGLIDSQCSFYINEKKINSNLLIDIFGCGYVGSSSFFRKDTILNNIILGSKKSEIDFNLIKKCCEISRCYEFIINKKNGFNHELTEWASNISEGQRQRLAIARMLYLDSPIFILDEATSALDINNEQKVLKKIFEQNRNKIFFVVSHRHESLKFANKIYEIKNNKVNFS